VLWVNPVSDTEQVMIWLEGGKVEAKWKFVFGSQP
jgi:hypothetical protein